MKISVVDLRYRMNEILKAINRDEEVTILYHGKVIEAIKPKISRSRRRILDHPFFNMYPSKGRHMRSWPTSGGTDIVLFDTDCLNWAQRDKHYRPIKESKGFPLHC